ncbi:aromatic ring-hydroxylating dioxygenase subunit alpha [Microbacterium betulae]|uniref:Aromatic ring-hydroxylating dioxygenase subunit alpha n=1 Tax=Microbacterium betulae TaxID=2981139 RepID=A0AA97FL50_9MICO|nr:aromatic ring-hydroxylating dioxygenase subunit alpha [Microbacterium sp. AB]WOF23452.1 aromatic ring-hydroxylating dioxygenase subunit alpha [Microbacterium sp. AB]
MIIEQLDNPLPGSLLPTLAGGYYTDPAVFAQEQERIFEQSWFCVVHGSDIPDPGDYRLVQVGREQLIVSRNRRREVRAFFNVCRHRGMRVCTEEAGTRRTFQCGYHAWTYDLDGRLIAAPNLTRMPDIDRDDYGLRRIHVREWLGYVWVCTAEEAPSFEETVLSEVVNRLGEVESLDRYQVENLAIGRRIAYDVHANWKLVIENFMECYHCATIHPELTQVIPEFAEGWAAQTNVGLGAEFGEGIEGFTVDGSAGAAELPLIAPGQERRYFAITIRPNVFVNMVPDHVIVHRMFPVSESSTYVECDWLFLPEVVDSARDVSKSVELFDRVNLQDFDACEKTQPAMSSRLYRTGGALVPAEHHIAFFHQWLVEALRP